MIAVYILLALAVFSSAEETIVTDAALETRLPTETCFDAAGESLCKVFQISCNDPEESLTAETQCAFTCRRC